MSLIVRLDDWLVSVFQKASDWLRDRTDRTCFFYARMCIWLSLIAKTAEFIGEEHKTGWDYFWIVAFGILFIILLQVIEGLDRRMERYQGKVMSPYRPFFPWGFFRIMMLGFVFIEVLLMWVVLSLPDTDWRDVWQAVASLIDQIGFFGYAGFLSCTPKPPRPLKAGNEIAHGAS